METILSSKGQLVIPKTLREEFGLSEGDRVALVSRGSYIAVIPLTKVSVAEAMKKVKGSSVKFPGLEAERTSVKERRERGRG